MGLIKRIKEVVFGKPQLDTAALTPAGLIKVLQSVTWELRAKRTDELMRHVTVEQYKHRAVLLRLCELVNEQCHLALKEPEVLTARMYKAPKLPMLSNYNRAQVYTLVRPPFVVNDQLEDWKALQRKYKREV